MHGRTAWQRGHESVVHAWSELAKQANVSVDTGQELLPRPVHTETNQRWDIKFNLLGRDPNVPVTATVGDVSITHAALGSGPRRPEWGTFKHQALADRVGSTRNSTYAPFHRDQNMEFLALVDTTGPGGAGAPGNGGCIRGKGMVDEREKGKGYSAFFHLMCSSNACRYGGRRLAMALCKASGQLAAPTR